MKTPSHDIVLPRLAVGGVGAAVALAFVGPSTGAAQKKAPAKKAPPKATDDKDTLSGEIAVSEVPPAIKRAGHRLVKDAKWTSASKTKSDGQDMYELFGKDAKGQSVSVEITAEGSVTSVERGIDPKDLPNAVTAAVTARMPAFKAETALELYHGEDIRSLDKAELAYQLNGTAAKGKDLSVEVTPKGTITEVKREIESADVPKAVADVLAQKAPRFKPHTVHRITQDDKVVGYLFSGKRGRVAFVSKDGKEFEIHKEE